MAGKAAAEKKSLGSGAGPYDISELVSTKQLSDTHLDLGSVLIPVVDGGQVSVEMSAEHEPQAVYLETELGRISVASYAAPKSPGQWRDVVGELAESLRAEGAETTVVQEQWGREVVAVLAGGVHRFIGVDGPRWMVRAVASAPEHSADELAQLARTVVSESVVRRGDEPYPPRTPLPLTLPEILAEQVDLARGQIENGEIDFSDETDVESLVNENSTAAALYENSMIDSSTPEVSSGSAIQQLRARISEN